LRGAGAQARAAGELLVGGQLAEVLAELLGRVDDQRLQLSDRLRSGDDRALAGREQDAERLPPTALTGLREVLTRERFAGGADGVEFVRPGPGAAGCSRWAVDLDHPLGLLEQEGRQAGAEAACPLDRPHPTALRPLARKAEQALIAEGVGRNGRFRGDGTIRVADRDRV
jgi:hypothetical protein